METWVSGELLAEGKTKRIWEAEGIIGQCVIEAKDDLTAGDGLKHDVIAGKAILATRTTTNVFRLLQKSGLEVAFVTELDETRFFAWNCDMIPYEVVVRREAHGSYLKRNPYLPRGHFFPRLILEFFLKTSGKRWKDAILTKDDPLVRFSDGRMLLFLPDEPLYSQSPFLILEDFPLRGFPEKIHAMGQAALKAFLVLEKAWQLLGRRLADFKVEFGEDIGGDLLLADVIDNDSWRLLEGGGYIDKQLYRDGANLDIVSAKYRLVSELTERFHVPRQQIILWRGSASDDLKVFEQVFRDYAAMDGEVKFVTCSTHKEPMRACEELGRLVQEVPDTVVISYVGRSNGAGPTLSAQTSVPVITVPATWRECPQDVWSSLRTPGEAPVLTVLEPGNAVLAALQMLAMRNPKLYAQLRMRQEGRFSNMAQF